MYLRDCSTDSRAISPGGLAAPGTIEAGVGCTCPAISRCRYGASNAATSSAPSSISDAAIASANWLTLSAPIRGAVTPGACNSHATATCAGDTPRSAATRFDGIEHLEIMCVRPYKSCASTSSAARRSRVLPPRSRLPVRKPRASGLHGITPDALVDTQGNHLALFFPVHQVVMVLHRNRTMPSMRARQCTAAWKIATPPCCWRQGSGPCPSGPGYRAFQAFPPAGFPNPGDGFDTGRCNPSSAGAAKPRTNRSDACG